MSRLALVATAAAVVVAGSGSGAGHAGTLPGTRTAADRAAWRASLHWPADCDRSWAQTGTGAGIVVWTTAAGFKLVAVSCLLGAYQGTQRLFVLTAGRHTPRPLSLLTYRDPGSGRPKVTRERQILGTIAFDPSRERLSVLDRFRGPGDCGIYSVFRLVGERFTTVEVRSKPDCDGRPPYDPLRWPRLPNP